MRVPLILFAVLFLGVMVVGPLINVFVQGFELGLGVVVDDALDRTPRRGIAPSLQVDRLIAAAVSRSLFNLTSSAWPPPWADLPAFAFRRQGPSLNSLIDLPFSVSPVIAGLIFVLLFGWLTAVVGAAGLLDR